MTYIKLYNFRQDGALTRENIEWLETVFRDNVGEGQTEFTLNQFKKIVPSKNVSIKYHAVTQPVIMNCSDILCGGSIQNI